MRGVVLVLLIAAGAGSLVQLWAQGAGGSWTFAVSGDSRNCGDFTMPAIAARVKAEGDAFYWHLGDFRIGGKKPDEDIQAMLPAGQTLDAAAYNKMEWQDFVDHQIKAFGDLPVFLGRGNHETNGKTRDDYLHDFASFLNRPEIAAQRKADGGPNAPLEPWYHWIRGGVDFITLDNASHDEFSDEQLHWLRGVLNQDLAADSGVHSIVAGMHEALPHSTSSNHAMDDWDQGVRTGEMVYNWFYDAEAAGKHVYLIASHSHYFSPNVFATPYWRQHSNHVVPGWIIGSAGAHRYRLPKNPDPEAKTDVYGYMQGTVTADGKIAFTLRTIERQEMKNHKWPNAPDAAIDWCFDANSDSVEEKKAGEKK
jgi:hypothetical protein